MTNLSTLLKKSRELHRQQIEIEHQIAELDRQMLAAEAPPKARKRGTKEAGDIGDAIRAVVKLLCDATEPLPPREIATRLGIEPGLASQRLHRAVKLGLVERTGNARYRATNDIKHVLQGR
jgi:hypothetical protein